MVVAADKAVVAGYMVVAVGKAVVVDIPVVVGKAVVVDIPVVVGKIAAHCIVPAADNSVQKSPHSNPSLQ